MTVRAPARRLFRRAPDKAFATFDDLAFHCSQVRHTSRRCWETPARLAITSELRLVLGEAELALNDWSFGQLCRLAGLDKAALNRLTPRLASHVLQRMLPRIDRPWEFLATWGTVRAIRGLSYSRLWNCELLSVLREFAPVWRSPPGTISGSLVCGEQDLFCFLVNITGAVEIDGDEFVPGFAVWNSEVGSRSLGIQAFWHQRGCQNHLFWDPLRWRPFVRSHFGDVWQGGKHIRMVVESLDRQFNQQREEFTRVVRKANRLRLGCEQEEAFRELTRLGISTRLAGKSLALAKCEGRLTIFAVADALTRLSQDQPFAAKRAALDHQAASLLALAK